MIPYPGSSGTTLLSALHVGSPIHSQLSWCGRYLLWPPYREAKRSMRRSGLPVKILELNPRQQPWQQCFCSLGSVTPDSDSGSYLLLAASFWYPQVRTCRQKQCDSKFGCLMVEGVSESENPWEMSAQIGLQAPGRQGPGLCGLLIRIARPHSGPCINICAGKLKGRRGSWEEH